MDDDHQCQKPPAINLIGLLATICRQMYHIFPSKIPRIDAVSTVKWDLPSLPVGGRFQEWSPMGVTVHREHEQWVNQCSGLVSYKWWQITDKQPMFVIVKTAFDWPFGLTTWIASGQNGLELPNWLPWPVWSIGHWRAWVCCRVHAKAIPVLVLLIHRRPSTASGPVK